MENKKNIDLKFLYSEIKNEVRGADSKLGTMITIMSLIIATIGITMNSIGVSWKIMICIISPFMIQALIAMIGIFPYMRECKTKKKYNIYKNDYYFKYIASFENKNAYFLHLKKKYSVKENDKELIVQIYSNAFIANRKYKIYKFSWIFYWPVLFFNYLSNNLKMK